MDLGAERSGVGSRVQRPCSNATCRRHDSRHDNESQRLTAASVCNYGNVIAESLAIAAAPVAGADLWPAGNDLVNTLQMLGQFVATRMILTAASSLESRIASLGRLRPAKLRIQNEQRPFPGTCTCRTNGPLSYFRYGITHREWEDRGLLYLSGSCSYTNHC